MKRYNNLFDKIVTYENFRLAYKNAIKGKKHYTEVKRIERHRTSFIKKTLEEVKSGTYKIDFSDYTEFNLFTGGKWRRVAKLQIKHRMVQHAIMYYLEPIFRESFIVDTFSSIKFRGIHRGLARVKTAVKDTDYQYVLQLDIRHCYQSLDHDILKEKLANKLKDEKLLKLLYIIIDSYPDGVPIGNYTSQYFNNYYFSDLDHFIKEVLKIKYYFRYCDDIVILGKSKEELRKIYAIINEYIQGLNVELKSNYKIYPKSKGVDFLGYITYENHIRLRKRTKNNFIAKVSKMDFDNLTKKDINILGSYWGILCHADCLNLWYKYVGEKTYADLQIKLTERNRLENLIGVPLLVTKTKITKNCKYKQYRIFADFELNGIKHKDVMIKVYGEIMQEAIDKIKPDDVPFTTIISINELGYYIFT